MSTLQERLRKMSGAVWVVVDEVVANDVAPALAEAAGALDAAEAELDFLRPFMSFAEGWAVDADQARDESIGQTMYRVLAERDAAEAKLAAIDALLRKPGAHPLLQIIAIEAILHPSESA